LIYCYYYENLPFPFLFFLVFLEASLEDLTYRLASGGHLIVSLEIFDNLKGLIEQSEVLSFLRFSLLDKIN